MRQAGRAAQAVPAPNVGRCGINALRGQQNLPDSRPVGCGERQRRAYWLADVVVLHELCQACAGRMP